MEPMDGKVPKTYGSPQQTCPESAKQQHSQSLQLLGEDKGTCPCRNGSVNNRGRSSAKDWNLSVNQHFLCPLQFGIFDLTTYLPADREKPGDSGFYISESPDLYQPACFPASTARLPLGLWHRHCGDAAVRPDGENAVLPRASHGFEPYIRFRLCARPEWRYILCLPAGCVGPLFRVLRTI